MKNFEEIMSERKNRIEARKDELIRRSLLSEEFLEMIQKNLILPEEATAPIKAGQQAGEAQYTLNGEVIGTVPILFAASVKKAVYRDYVIKIIGYFLL